MQATTTHAALVESEVVSGIADHRLGVDDPFELSRGIVGRSLMLVTALSPEIGYDRSSRSSATDAPQLADTIAPGYWKLQPKPAPTTIPRHYPSSTSCPPGRGDVTRESGFSNMSDGSVNASTALFISIASDVWPFVSALVVRLPIASEHLGRLQ
jgi:hypothetical protein